MRIRLEKEDFSSEIRLGAHKFWQALTYCLNFRPIINRIREDILENHLKHNCVWFRLILDRYWTCFAATTKTFIWERCGPQTRYANYFSERFLYDNSCNCICREGVVTGIALVHSLKATGSAPRGRNRCAPIWLVVNRRGCMGGDAQSTEVHHSAVQAACTGQKGLWLCGSCKGWRVILEDRDKYYTFSSPRRASAPCLIYAPPRPSCPHWLNEG